MSSRAIRRLERKKEQSDAQIFKSGSISASESEEEEESPIQAKRVNAFAFLGSEEEESSQDEEPYHEDTKNEEVELDEGISSDDFLSADEGSDFRPPEEVVNEKSAPIKSSNVTTTATKKSKKKKSKKKGKNNSKSKSVQNVNTIDDDELDALLKKVQHKDGNFEKSTEFDDDLDNLEIEDDEDDEDDDVAPLKTYTPGGKGLTTAKFKSCLPLLRFNAKDLDPDREFENLFGKLSASAIDDADATPSTFVSPEILQQIKKMAKRVRGWSGRDRRTVPGTARKLVMTKIRDDWIPVPHRPLLMDELTTDDLLHYFTSKYPDDWRDVLKNDIKAEYSAGIRYFEVSASNAAVGRELTTEFYIAVTIQPDHETLIGLLRKYPYHLETVLQVTNVLQRQGDNSHTNGLIERAIFIFDWCLRNTFELGSGLSRLPFEFYLNRQIYLTLYRYIGVLTQKSTFYTALNYCKLLLSFDPTDDPYGVRYFISLYAVCANEYQYLIDFVNSKLVTVYREWFTDSLAYSVVVCYYQLNMKEKAIEALKLAFQEHQYTGFALLGNLTGDESIQWKGNKVSTSVELSTAMYMTTCKLIFEDKEAKSFMIDQLQRLIHANKKQNEVGPLQDVKEVPRNLLRNVILSNETSAMAKLPPLFWDQNEIFEYDVLPPSNGSTIVEYIDENKVGDAMIQQSFNADQDTSLSEILRQIRLGEQQQQQQQQ
ncbi:hypothetical protein CANARDRAFT_27825 [[Candida] arabinofermentans NRRL YB-2248]|uniref:Ribosome quality control complex subunit 1 n=1 Tax=[Candida] arabinofermentans NRRL YB-2248 TaxID=983967 RepID=A0A1E4T1V0_9ASCO|nr:hypothetical protein CANARDRAFT_27825 [[Candida] arabinofermentans NRRL YB-2248]